MVVWMRKRKKERFSVVPRRCGLGRRLAGDLAAERHLFQFDFHDLPVRTSRVTKPVDDLGVHPVEIARLDFVLGGLAVGRGGFQDESLGRDN